MKKILYLCPRFVATISGVETYLQHLFKYMKQRYEIHLFTRYEKRKRSEEDLAGVTIHYIEGFDSTNVDLYKALPAMKKLLGSIKPDIVHAHCAMSLMLFKMITVPGEYPTVVTMHSTPDGHSRFFGWFNDFETEIMFCRSLFSGMNINALLFGSDYYREQYTSRVPEMFEAGTQLTLPYFSALPGLSVDEKRKIQDAKRDNLIRILFPSRIMKRKGIEETLQVLSMLPDEYVLTLPGYCNVENADYVVRVNRLINELRLEKRVIKPKSVVFHNEMDAFYKEADICVIPSHYEGFGIVAVEAMDYCVPVISTCAGGLSEIITPQYNGVKIDVNDINSFKREIINIHSDASFQNLLVKNGKNTVSEKFSFYGHMATLGGIYENAFK